MEKLTQTDPQTVFVLLDYKINAILGVFSTLDKVLGGKKAAMKRDLNIIKKKINERLTLDKLNDIEKNKLIGLLTQIEFIKNDFDNRYDKIIFEYDGYLYTNRYIWYRIPVDVFNIDKSTFGPIVLLPNPTN